MKNNHRISQNFSQCWQETTDTKTSVLANSYWCWHCRKFAFAFAASRTFSPFTPLGYVKPVRAMMRQTIAWPNNMAGTLTELWICHLSSIPGVHYQRRWRLKYWEFNQPMQQSLCRWPYPEIIKLICNRQWVLGNICPGNLEPGVKTEKYWRWIWRAALQPKEWQVLQLPFARQKARNRAIP